MAANNAAVCGAPAQYRHTGRRLITAAHHQRRRRAGKRLLVTQLFPSSPAGSYREHGTDRLDVLGGVDREQLQIRRMDALSVSTVGEAYRRTIFVRVSVVCQYQSFLFLNHLTVHYIDMFATHFLLIFVFFFYRSEASIF